MRRGLDRLSLGHNECSMKADRCCSSYYSCYCHCLHAQQQKAEDFEHRLEMLTFPGWFQPWDHFSLPTEGQASSQILPPYPHECHTSSPQYSACCYLCHWHPTMFPLCYSKGTRTTSGKMIEWVGGPLQAASTSSYCPKQFSSGSDLHVPFNCTTGLWFTGPPSLDSSLRNICYDVNTCWGVSFFRLEQLIKVFLLPHLAPSVSLCHQQCFSILCRLVLCVPPHLS